MVKIQIFAVTGEGKWAYDLSKPKQKLIIKEKIVNKLVLKLNMIL